MPLMPGAGLEMLEWEINALGVAEGVAALTRLGATVAKKGGAALLEKSLGTAGSEINAGTKIGSAVTTAESGMSAGTHTATVETETVFHTVTDPRAAQGVLDGVNTAKLNPQSRFGKALYISDDASTTLAELSYHNAAPTQTIRYEMDLTKAKILDLTDPTVAKSWGYDGGPISNATKAIGEQAQQAGYNTIKFQSMRGAGTNYAVLSDFEQVLKPQMVVPTPPAPPSTTLPAPDFKK
jgi:RES domain-containing protein